MLSRVRPNHGPGSWCRICAKGGRRLGIEQMRELARSRGGRCLSTVYHNSLTPLRWQCAEGHEWLATAGNVHKRRGTWCPFCGHRRP
ncbi:MAG: hypothetical protein HY261_11345 [Chloroflexi bacterium]|nr:hypothetical protein [Chloroflexota bacterium]